MASPRPEMSPRSQPRTPARGLVQRASGGVVTAWAIANALACAAAAPPPPPPPPPAPADAETTPPSEPAAQAHSSRDQRVAQARADLQARIAARVRAQAQADRDAATVELPVTRLPTGHLAVEVAIGTPPRPLLFVLDTGASHNVITPAARDTFGLAADAGTRVQARGAGGQTAAEVRLVALPPVQVGERSYGDLHAAVIELGPLAERMGTGRGGLPPLGGILGRPFLRRHDVALDPSHARLSLHGTGWSEGEGAALLAGAHAIPFASFAGPGLMQVQLTLADGPAVPAVFDLGASRTVLHPEVLRRAGIDPDGPRTRADRERLLGADDRALRARVFDGAALDVGGLAFPPRRVWVAALPVFADLVAPGEPVAIVGLDLFEGRGLVLDEDRPAVFVLPATSAQAQRGALSQAHARAATARSPG